MEGKLSKEECIVVAEAKSDVEKGREIRPLPEPSGNLWASNLRHRLYGVYRRLFTVLFMLNLAGFTYVCITQTTPNLPTLANIAIPIAANVFLAGLFRTDYFINFLYTAVLWVPLWVPLSIRRRLANIYEFGGVHSGAGVASAIWSLLFVVKITQGFVAGQPVGVESVVITYLLVALLVIIVGGAHPTFRRMQHNWFEALHRICGWMAIALFWVLTVSLTRDIAAFTSQSIRRTMFTGPLIYFLIAITALTILPWLRLRKVEAEAVKLSEHAVRIYFKRPKVGLVQGIRISESPLLEWHSFASIPNSFSARSGKEEATEASQSLINSTGGHSILVSAAGDWTRNAIGNTITSRKYWVRGVPVTGVARCALLFKRVVVVTTGTGIGPALSVLAGVVDRSNPQIASNSDLESADQLSSSSTLVSSSSTCPGEPWHHRATKRKSRRTTPCRLIWSTPNPIATYGDGLVDEVRGADPGAIIWDTRQHGRPDLVALTWTAVQEFDAEAVVCISNPKVTDMVVFGMRSRGLPAYGPIFDS